MPTLSADGDTAEVNVKGPVHVHASGTFGGGTITFKFEGADGTYHDIANGAFTAAADKTFTFNRETKIKGTLAGATGPSLFYEIR